MKKKSLLILGVIGLVLVVGFQLLKTENVSAQTQKKWEYFVYEQKWKFEPNQKTLNDLGNEGWELIQVEKDFVNEVNRDHTRYIFKRQK